MQINSNQKTINKYEIPIAPYLKDLSSVAMYLDEMNFQLLTQIEPYKNNNIWTAVSLHGFGACPSDIFKPGFTKNKIIVDTKLQWTTLRNLSVMKPLCEIVFNLPCDFERIRIMKLLSGKALKKHTDNIDNDIKNKKVVRLHIPIRTSNDVIFTLYNNEEDKVGEEINLKTGHYYYLDVTKPHSVRNKSSVDRYHLVVDCFVNDELKALLHNFTP